MVIVAFLAQGALLAAEVWALKAWAGLPLRLVPAHAALAFLYALAFGACLRRRYPVRTSAGLGGMLALLLPGVGMACASLAGLLLAYKPLESGDLIKEFKEHSTLPEWTDPKFKPPVGERVLEASRGVEPLVDMLASPDPKLKRAALEAVAKRRNPDLFGYILEALSDPRPEIYQFAMAQVLKLQGEYAKAISSATEAAKTCPDRVESHRGLAEACGRYLKSGLADPAVAGFYRECLREAYRRILELSPGEGEVYAALGRLSLETGKPAEAQECYEQALKLKPYDLGVRYGLIETLYDRGDYRAMILHLRRLVAETAAREGPEPEPVRLARWWLTSGSETATG